MERTIAYTSDWKDAYKRKLMSTEDAAKLIQSRQRIFTAGFGGDPETFFTALARRKDELEGVIVSSCNSILRFEHNKPEYEGHFINEQWFLGAGARESVSSGRGTYVPCNFGDFDRYLAHEQYDYATMLVSPPDKNGFMSFGLMVAFSRTIARHADKVIVQVNQNYPRVLGDTFIHVSEVDHIVEANDPLLTIPEMPISETSRTIAEYIAEKIEDGSTLQLGIGGIPNAVGNLMMHKKDLGIHSEMITDAVMELAEAGVVTGRKKTLHPRTIVGTFVGGSQKLYDWTHDNPLVAGYPVGYTNDPCVIAQNHKQISINAALEVDLTGQASSESIGNKQYSGVGGQVDFVRGATQSPGGQSFLVLNSTAEVKGQILSTIVPQLKTGGFVTTSRNDIDNVVTEYGIAPLRGRNVRQRVEALVSIAHPDFRNELMEQARKAKFI